jgi:hypothetical protein
VVKGNDLLLVRTKRRLWTAQAGRVTRRGRATRGERISIAATDKALRALVAPRIDTDDQ